MKSEQIDQLATALAKAQGEIKGAVKDSENPFFKSSYADLASVWEAIRAPLSKYGLAVIQTTDTDEGGMYILTTLAHASGQWIDGKFHLSPKDGSAQAIGSATSYARRYALAAISGVYQVDDDAEGAMGRKPEPKVNSVTHVTPITPQPATSPTAFPDVKKASPKQCAMIWAKLKNELGMDDESARDFIGRTTGKEQSKDLTTEDITLLLSEIDTEAKAAVK